MSEKKPDGRAKTAPINGLLGGRPVGTGRFHDSPQLREQLQGLGRIHCTLGEIATVLGVSLDGVKLAFRREPPLREDYERGMAEGKQSLRRAQMDCAMSGNPQMLIWLGKTILGQRDDINITVDAKYVVGVKAEMFEDEEAFERKFLDVTPEAAAPKRLGNGKLAQ